ncbi:Lrp/AsnC family transcriptional regulator [Candidatus Bathyarchaeota archaeon]|nr:Lrp/AsnC family transcriptional regulator [Candidatus Bathyarchaeota archaeon]
MKAYVLLNTDLGMEPEVIKNLSSVKDIKKCYSLYGIYDILVEVEGENMDKIKDIIFNTIRRAEYVKSTITLITYGDPLIND